MKNSKLREFDKPPKDTSYLDLLAGSVLNKKDNFIEPEDSLMDNAIYLYNKHIAQKLVDENSEESPFYQPDTVVRKGKTFKTNNKFFNDYTEEELARKKYELSQEKGDRVYYELENGDTEKAGTAKFSVWDRYKGNPLFKNWESTKEVRTKNANYIEKLTHGNINNLERRKFDYADPRGKTELNTLGEAPTEQYFKSKPIQVIDKETDKYLNQIMTPEQKEIQNFILGEKTPEIIPEQNYTTDKPHYPTVENDELSPADKANAEASIKRQEKWENVDSNKSIPKNLYSNETDNWSVETFKKELKKEDEKSGTGNAKGAIDEYTLSTKPQYQNIASRLTKLFNIKEDISPFEKAQELNKAMSLFNNNITYFANKVANISQGDKDTAKALADAIEIFDTTDLDLNQIGRAAKGVALDPTTMLTLGGNKLIEKIGGNISKKGLLNYLKGIVNTPGVKQGVLEGGAYTGIFDAGRQGVNLKGDKQENFNIKQFLTSVGTGALIGGTAGKIIEQTVAGKKPKIKHEELNNRLKELNNLVNNEKNIKERRELKKERKNLAKVEKELSEIKKDTTINDKEKEKKIEQVEDEAISLWEKEGYLKIDHEERKRILNEYQKVEVKPESTITVSKSKKSKEVKQYGKEFLQAHNEDKNFKFELNDPRQDKGKEVNFNDIPTDKLSKRIIKFKKKIQASGRKDDTGYILSPQSTADDVASLKLIEEKEIKTVTDLDENVNEFLKIHDEQAKIERQYGTDEARYIKEKHKSENQLYVNRMNEEKQYLYHLIKKENISQKIKQNIADRIELLKNQKITEYKKLEKNNKIAEEIFVEKNIPTIFEKKQKEDYEINMLKDYEKRYEEMKKKGRFIDADNPNRSKEKQEELDTKTVNEITKTLKENELEVAIANRELRKKILLSGKENWNGEITKEIEKDFPKESKKILTYLQRKSDLKDKNISIKELRYREERRLQEELNDINLGKNATEVKKNIQRIQEKFENIGIKSKAKVEIKNNKKKDISDEQKEEKKEISKEQQYNIDQSLIKKELNKQRQIEDKIRNYKTARYKNDNLGKIGQLKITKQEKKYIEEGIFTEKELAEAFYPVNKNGKPYTSEEFKVKQKENFEELNKKARKKHEKNLGINSENKKQKIRLIKFSDTIMDASNSVLQIISTLSKSIKLGSKSKLTGNNKDIRIEIASLLNKKRNENFSEALGKNLVKKLFMIEPYGAGEQKLIQTVMQEFQKIFDDYNVKQKIDREFAEKYVQDYYDVSEQLLPELKEFSNAIYKKMEEKGFNGEVGYELPTGFKVKISLTKEIESTVKIRGRTMNVKMNTKQLKKNSKSLMPLFVQSIDAMIAHRMHLKGYPTNHDAFRLLSGRKKSQADRDYAQIISEINRLNLLDDVMRQIEIDIPKSMLKDKSKLTKVDIYNSDFKLGTEHRAEELAMTKQRKEDNEYLKNESEILREFMAKDNHRQIPLYSLIDKMVNEASISPRNIMHEFDDVYERQLALAHTQNKYRPEKSIQPPSGINKEKWHKEQEKIFNEFRAKLEYNELMNYRIRGRRIFFGKDNEPIKGKTNPLEKEIELQHELGLEKYKEKTTEENLIARNREGHKVKIISFKSELKKRNIKKSIPKKPDVKLKEELEDIVQIEKKKKLLNGEYISYIERQFGNTEESKQFNKLNNEVQSVKRIAERKKEALTLYWDKKIPKEKNDEILKHVLQTDYAEIYGMKKKEAKNFLNKYSNLYYIAKKEIDQMARAIGRKENQVGYYYDNAEQVAVKYNLDKNDARIIDKIISIKAMSDDSWNFVEKEMNNEWFKVIIEARTEDKKRSKKLFNENEENYVKGWLSDEFDNSLTIDNSGKVIKNVDAKYTHTALVADLEQNTIGKALEEVFWKNINLKLYDVDKNKKILHTLKSFNQAEKDNVKITGKIDRAVARKEIREELGQSTNVSEILAGTTSSIDQKETRRTVIQKTLNGDYGLLFSKEEKEGMRPITKEEEQLLPYDFKGQINFVNKNLERQLLTTQRKRIFGINDRSSRILKIIDTAWVDAGKRFKQNVVLKNIPSFKNAYLFNYTIAMSAGINPIKLAKWQKEAFKQRRIDKRNMQLYSAYQSRGLHKRAERMKEKLMQSELFQMEMKGLATNVLEGVKQEKDIFSHEFKNKIIDKIFDNLLLNQNSKVGKITTELFSDIDTAGRYSMVKAFEEKGLTRDEAILKANGILGDLDQIAPIAIEMMDDYGGAYFAKWASQTMPQILKITKDNPVKATSIAVSLFMISQYMEKEDKTEDKWGSMNLSGINPIESYLDYTEMQFGKWEDKINTYKRGGFEELAMRELAPHFIPSIILKPVNYVRTEKKKADKKKKEMEIDISRLIKKVIAPDRGALYDFEVDGKKAPLDTRGYSQELVESLFPELINKKQYEKKSKRRRYRRRRRSL